MIKKLQTLVFALFLVLMSLPSNAQQLAIGLNGGGGISNIFNYDNEGYWGRGTIGDELWTASYGASAVFYFKDPMNVPTTGRLALLYRNSTRGAVSEEYKDHKFKFNVNTVGLTVGVSRNISNGFFGYIDLGLGYNFIDNANPYIGTKNQLDAFNSNLVRELAIKSGELMGMIAVGAEKNLLKDKLRLSLGLTLDLGLTDISSNVGHYKTQGFGLELGLRYVINFLPKPKS